MSDADLGAVSLSTLSEGDQGVFFALLSAKEAATTRDGKPFYKVTFRDRNREATIPVWQDSPWYKECRDAWKVGEFYKLHAQFRVTGYGNQLELKRIRGVTSKDQSEGFDPSMCLPRSLRPPEELFGELKELVQSIGSPEVRAVLEYILVTHQERWLAFPAERNNHHVYVGGLLEHTLCVAQTALHLAQRYPVYYPELEPPLDVDLVLAGAILHDCGKLLEIVPLPLGAELTPEGDLVGHLVLGRDLLREAIAAVAQQGHVLDEERRLRLEHVILSHHRLPEFGSPKPPMTPEAMLVHFANEIDVKYHMIMTALQLEPPAGHATSKKNILGQRLFRGLPNRRGNESGERNTANG